MSTGGGGGWDEQQARKRRWVDAPSDVRCLAVITLSDGTKADCGRRQAKGQFVCWQHARAVKRLTAKILANLEKPRPVRTEAEVFAGMSEECFEYAKEAVRTSLKLSPKAPWIVSCPVPDEAPIPYTPEACVECHLSKSEFREGPVLRCLRCQKALCFLCTGVHLDCRNRCEEAK